MRESEQPLIPWRIKARSLELVHSFRSLLVQFADLSGESPSSSSVREVLTHLTVEYVVADAGFPGGPQGVTRQDRGEGEVRLKASRPFSP